MNEVSMPTAPWLRHDVSTTVGTLAVWERGEGDAVVMRHGIFFDHGLWTAQAEELAQSHRTILIDGPGHGASVDRGSAYTLFDDAQATVEVLEALGVQEAVLVGHSWGGMSAVRAALCAPERVRALALVDTPLEPGTALGRLKCRALRELIQAVGAPRWYGAQVAAAMFSAQSRARNPRLTSDLQHSLRAAPRFALARAMDAVLVRPDDVLDRLGAVTVPIMILAGDQDYVLPPSTRDTLARVVPHATVEMIPGKHVLPLEQPTETTARLVAFLEGLSQ